MDANINEALTEMVQQIITQKEELIAMNTMDVNQCDETDKSLYDRLFINEQKVDGMIDSLQQLIAKPSPLGQERYRFTHENGIEISNKTVPFGTILIIYESRPDVTVEATAIALKSGNKILLKGGKEAKRSNLFLYQCWLRALNKAGIDEHVIQYLNINRTEMQEFLKEPDTPIDLIIPRGGETLIAYVKSVAQCPVLVSGRGNNFMYISQHADLKMAKELVIQSKVSKISACNALDKVLVHNTIDESFIMDLKEDLIASGVELISPDTDEVWKEEFLDMKIVVEQIDSLDEAMTLINRYSGGHSATIVTDHKDEVEEFMRNIDCAAVYHNASTRFTDGFQFGLGAEMAISTDKLHHRGPLGLEHLVTNKWYIKGNGQTR